MMSNCGKASYGPRVWRFFAVCSRLPSRSSWWSSTPHCDSVHDHLTLVVSLRRVKTALNQGGGTSALTFPLTRCAGRALNARQKSCACATSIRILPVASRDRSGSGAHYDWYTSEAVLPAVLSLLQARSNASMSTQAPKIKKVDRAGAEIHLLRAERTIQREPCCAGRPPNRITC